jgi:hypothetical protein
MELDKKYKKFLHNIATVACVRIYCNSWIEKGNKFNKVLFLKKGG